MRLPAWGDVGELAEVAGPGVDLQQQLGQVDAGQHPLRPLAQRDQRRRVGVDAGFCQMDLGATVGAGHDVQGRVGGQPGGNPPVGGVQHADQLGQMPRGPLRQPERGQHPRLGRGPRRPVQQPGARVAPAGRVLGEHIAAAQRPVELLEHTERVGAMIDHARLHLRVVEH
jgi:hypothetical protein